MCGFAAIFTPGAQVTPDLLQAIEADLFHRGPDAGGSLRETGWAFAFRRLSIIDTTSFSDQPMTDSTGRYSIVFNGEIYNYRDLRSELIGKGVVFRTQGDTEVLLQGFIQWGKAVFRRLEGMFAAVIVDRQKALAIAARDPFGIKPLYRTVEPRGVALASEMRPLRRLVAARPDPAAIGELLTFRFAGGRRSNLTGIEKVPAGSLLEIDIQSGTVRESRYEDILDTIHADESLSEVDALELSEMALTRSVRQHLESDVGYTLQLSGGIDSSLISAIAAQAAGRRLQSFSVQLADTAYDEGVWRKSVVERYNLDHHEVRMTEYDFAEALPKAVASMEGPSPHYGCVMLMMLCETISRHGKVVLTGEGADEMFGGYHRYQIWPQLQRTGFVASLMPERFWKAFLRYDGYHRYHRRDPAVWSSCYHDYLAMSDLFPGLVPSAGVRTQIAGQFKDFRSRMLAVDQTVYLESLLLRQDKMAMSASVEARVPFVHMPLARAVNRIPHHLRIPGGATKPLLKRIAEKYLPHDLVNRRKVGLTLPIVDWLGNSRGLGRYLDLLEAQDSRLAEFGSRTRLREAVRQFRAGRRQGGASLPLLVNVELWLRSLDAT